jgi:peptidoglycan/LPS O-acetylase OafA/YrhL
VQNYRNFSLDFVRGLSVLLIIFFHYNCATVRIISNELTLFSYYRYAGIIGVSMFFILSGAALTLSTQNNYSIVSFYKKRFMAIFPLFWATYIFIVFAISIIGQSSPFVDKYPPTFILTIFGIDGLLLYKIPNYYLIGEWFLGCIIVLYILFPAIRLLFNKNNYLLLISSLAFCIILEKFYNIDMPLLTFPLFRVFEFIFGMYFVTILNSNSYGRNLILLIASTVGIILFFSLPLHGLFFTYVLPGILFFVFLVSFAKIFEHYLPKKVISFLSKYSYTAFLVHHIILVKIVDSLKNTLLLSHYNYLVFFTTLFLIYLFSYLFYSALGGLFRNSILSK